MRKMIAFALAVVALSAGMENAFAKPSRRGNNEATRRPSSDSLAHLLKMNPAGGQPLTKAVEDLLKGAPSAAPRVVALAKKATPDQSASIAVGYARALADLQETDQEGARQLRAALSGADPIFGAMVAALEKQIYAEAAGGKRTGSDLGGGSFGGGGGFGGGDGINRNGLLISPN